MKSKFPKLTQSIFGLSAFWSEFRPSIAIICRNALQNSLSPKMGWVSFGNLLFKYTSSLVPHFSDQSYTTALTNLEGRFSAWKWKLSTSHTSENITALAKVQETFSRESRKHVACNFNFLFDTAWTSPEGLLNYQGHIKQSRQFINVIMSQK